MESLAAAVVLGVFLLGYKLWRPYIMQTDEAGAPFVPMEPDVVQRAMEVAKVGPGDMFYELGSGDGRVVIAAGVRGARSIGIELDKWRVLWSRMWVRIWGLQDRVKIVEKNFFDIDLSDATVIHTYLLEETNERLEPKLLKELKPGTRVVSVGFKFPNWKPVKVDPRGTIYGPIYLYVI